MMGALPEAGTSVALCGSTSDIVFTGLYGSNHAKLCLETGNGVCLCAAVSLRARYLLLSVGTIPYRSHMRHYLGF